MARRGEMAAAEIYQWYQAIKYSAIGNEESSSAEEKQKKIKRSEKA